MLSFGPWYSGANLTYFWEAGMDMMKVVGLDDPWLLKNWEGICADQNWHTSETTGRDQRIKYIANLPTHRPFYEKRSDVREGQMAGRSGRDRTRATSSTW